MSYGFAAPWELLRQLVGWDKIPQLLQPDVCREGDPRCWPTVHDQRHVLRKYSGRAKPRDASKVAAIEYHQMDCTMGVSRGQLKAAAGDPRLALRNRVLGQPYHVVGLLDGDVIRNHPASRITFHGNGGNDFTIGVGIEGSYPGREKSRSTKHTQLDRIVPIARAALVEAEKMLREAGVTGPIKINAHRCFTDGRAADPGEGLWRETVLWAVDQIGLVVDYDIARGTGLPIPVDWDPSAKFTWSGVPRG